MFSTKKFLQSGFLIFVSFLLLSGCSSDNQNAPGGSGTQQSGELVKINSVEVVPRPTSPVQVVVKLKGNLKDGCQKVGDISQKHEGNSFKVMVASKTEGDDCKKEPVPFQRNVGLDVAGLKAGKYQVDVNGVSGSFELTKDNK